jgi:hypothetical protein
MLFARFSAICKWHRVVQIVRAFIPVSETLLGEGPNPDPAPL